MLNEFLKLTANTLRGKPVAMSDYAGKFPPSAFDRQSGVNC